MLNQKFLGFDSHSVPTELTGQCGDDPKPASPFAKKVSERQIQGFDRLHRPPNVAEIASDILFDRTAVPGVPVRLK